jgi:hypothetical protein
VFEKFGLLEVLFAVIGARRVSKMRKACNAFRVAIFTAQMKLLLAIHMRQNTLPSGGMSFPVVHCLISSSLGVSSKILSIKVDSLMSRLAAGQGENMERNDRIYQYSPAPRPFKPTL